jgi:hypothetical protein
VQVGSTNTAVLDYWSSKSYRPLNRTGCSMVNCPSLTTLERSGLGSRGLETREPQVLQTIIIMVATHRPPAPPRGSTQSYALPRWHVKVNRTDSRKYTIRLAADWTEPARTSLITLNRRQVARICNPSQKRFIWNGKFVTRGNVCSSWRQF